MPRLPLPSATALATALAAALTAGFTTPARAVGQRVDVQVVDRSNGETLTPILHDGEWWVAGRPGARYRVVMVNHDGRRTLNVLSIDGVNAISGETAAWSQSGYVLNPFENTGIDGWRKDADRIAAFAFASLADSYATRTDRPTNVGVIGVAVFDEQVAPPKSATNAPPVVARRLAPPPFGVTPLMEADKPAQADAAPPVSSPAPAALAENKAFSVRDRLGTGYGDTEQSSMRWVAFRRAQPTPDEIVTIHYDRLENLIAMGIVPRPFPPVAANPFPDNHRYAPEPPPRR